MNSYFESNRQLWDQWTEDHIGSSFYDLPAFKAGKSSLNSIELEALSDVKNRSLLHLQCHFGQDSLSWAKLGAKVTGIDFSPKAVSVARNLALELELEARFIQSDVFDLKNQLEGQFDIVFTSYGAICWLNDLVKWADIITHFLKEGGVFYIVEFHPILFLLDFENLKLQYDYFSTGMITEEAKGSYAAPDSNFKHPEYTWNHSLEDILTPLLANGLKLLEFKEYPYSPYGCFPNMIEREKGKWVFEEMPNTFPYIFSLKMKK